MKAAEPNLEKLCEQHSFSLKTEMPEDSGMGLLPSFIDVANAEELTALLGGAFSCHYLQLSLSSLVVVATDTK